MDPGAIQINWAIYLFATEMVLIIVIVALFIYKKVASNQPGHPVI